jgi:hypothetical protein
VSTNPNDQWRLHLQFSHDNSLADLCERYRVSPITILSWRYMTDFPVGAISRASPGAPNMFDQAAIDEWLRNRPRHKRQRPARWWQAVGIKDSSGKGVTNGR